MNAYSTAIRTSGRVSAVRFLLGYLRHTRRERFRRGTYWSKLFHKKVLRCKLTAKTEGGKSPPIQGLGGSIESEALDKYRVLDISGQDDFEIFRDGLPGNEQDRRGVGVGEFL